MNSTRISGRRVGLARMISKLGYCSRSAASALIRAGRVTLNGVPRRDPESPVRPTADRIEIDGKPISTARFTYFLLNKPRGLVTTAADEKGRETVYTLVPSDFSWLAPVGRLDKASEGLLLLTNDSEWAAAITDPASHLPKVYHAQINKVADEGLLRSLRDGITTAAGEVLSVSAVSNLRAGQKNSWIEIVLEEGKNRHIRRMFESLGIEVLRLVRVSIGPLTLGNLPKGKLRELTHAEKRAMDAALRHGPSDRGTRG